MNKLLGLTLILLVLASSLSADLTPPCDQCHQSFLRLSICSPGDTGCSLPPAAASAPKTILISAHASFLDETAVNSNAAPASAAPGAQPVTPGNGNYLLTVRPAVNSILRITFDGQPLTDSNGQPLTACDGTLPQPPTRDPSGSMVTAAALTPTAQGLLSPGDAACQATYALDPSSPTPKGLALSDWPRCALLSVSLVSSDADSKIKPSSSSLVYCPSNLKSLGFFSILQALLSNSNTIRTCLPLFIVLGLLLSSMYYQGRNPLSLFDITTPRLPSVKKVKMKGATQPYQLSYKPRMSNRIIGRAERAISAQIGRLYKTSGASASSIAAARAAALAILPRKNDITRGVKPHDSADALAANLKRLNDLVDKSNARQSDRDRAKEAIKRMVQIRETLAIDMAATAAARAGGVTTLSQYNPKIEMVGTAIAKPVNFVLERLGVPKEKIDWIPGIPYVERLTLVATGFLSSRSGNIGMRQAVGRSLRAEVGKKLGLYDANSKFYKDNSMYGKKMGEIPHIIERMRNETHILGKAVIEEHLRLMAEAIYFQKTEGGYKLGEKGMKEFARMVRESTEKDAAGKEYLNRVKLAGLMADYIKANDLRLRDLSGSALSADETKSYLGKWTGENGIIAKAFNALKADDENAALFAGLPDLQKRVDPTQVHQRYIDMVNLLKPYEEEWKAGRVPLVMLGRDIADVIGRMLHGGQYTESERMAHIRLRMEEELIRKRFYDSVSAQLRREDGSLFSDLRKTAAGPSERVALQPFLSNGALNPAWLDRLRDEFKDQRGPRNEAGLFSDEKLRTDMNYTMRGEFAARGFLTGYTASAEPYTAAAERNRIIILRQLMGYQFDKGFENLFQTYASNVEHNLMQYHAMAGLSKFYLGKDWNADSYEEWKKRGVTYGDIQKGVWLIGGDKTITPMASRYERDAEGRITGASTSDAQGRSMIDAKGRLSYDIKSVSNLLISDYAERPINAQMLFSNDGKTWSPGAPTDRETMIMVNSLKKWQEELQASKYGKMSGEEHKLEEERLRKNIAQIETRLSERVKMATRTAVMEDDSIKMSAGTKAMWRATGFIERVARGGIHNIDERQQEWYSANSYARLVMATFARDWDSKKFLSEEVSASLSAKEQLTQYRQEEIALLRKRNLSADERRTLDQLRSVLIPEQIRFVREQESVARRANKEGYWADRQLKGVADMNNPFFNISEMTVMRDPRIAFGGGHGLGPAVMVGYQTGQFVGERPQMWAGYHIGPGDRVLNVLAKPAYMAAMTFGMNTRSFFSKMTGYTTIYHMDPETGHAGGTGHEGGLIQAFQSLFRPSESNDWFTRFYAKPMLRTKYSDEYGFSMKEAGSGVGERYIFPLTWKYGGTAKSRGADPLYATDLAKYQQMGMDAGEEVRRRKLGLTFREEYTLWDKRFAAGYEQTGAGTISALREQLRTASDSTERRIINSEIREMSDTMQTNRKAWSVPGIGSLFRQGYYGVENRAGYDISAIGGQHRTFEMSNPWMKNTGRIPFPGMMFEDWGGSGSDTQMQLYARVARTIVNAPKDAAGKDRPIYGLVDRITAANAEADAGLGRDLRRDAIRDTFRHETPFLSKFMELEMERMSFSFTNSPYIIPLAPFYVGVYQLLKKSAWGQRQPWSTATPSERGLGPLSEQEREQEARMQTYRAAANTDPSKHGHYTCPTHGIELPGSQACPLCRTQAAFEADSESKLGKRLNRYKEAAKNWADSATPFSGYTHYYNQAHCSTHGTAYERGTACPLCLQDQVKKSGGALAENASKFTGEVDKINKDLHQFAVNRSMDSATRAQEMDKLLAERDKLGEKYGLQLERDRRMGYEDSKEYIRSQMALIRKLEKENANRFS